MRKGDSYINSTDEEVESERKSNVEVEVFIPEVCESAEEPRKNSSEMGNDFMINNGSTQIVIDDDSRLVKKSVYPPPNSYDFTAKNGASKKIEPEYLRSP